MILNFRKPLHKKEQRELSRYNSKEKLATLMDDIDNRLSPNQDIVVFSGEIRQVIEQMSLLIDPLAVVFGSERDVETCIYGSIGSVLHSASKEKKFLFDVKDVLDRAFSSLPQIDLQDHVKSDEPFQKALLDLFREVLALLKELLSFLAAHPNLARVRVQWTKYRRKLDDHVRRVQRFSVVAGRFAVNADTSYYGNKTKEFVGLMGKIKEDDQPPS